MLNRMLIMSAFILIGSIAAFAQNGTANCPPDKVQVEREAKIGGVGVKETSCEDKGNTPIDRTVREVKETIDRVRGGADKDSKDNNRGGGRGWK